MNNYAVIMAGGSGTRFWPMSRQRRPKQLLQLLSSQPLIQETVERVAPLIPPSRVLIVCNHAYVEPMRALLPEMPPENFIGEPMGRNTAPCIALAAVEIARRDPDSVMCVLPADHHIRDVARFQKLLEIAMKGAAGTQLLVTFGIIPNKPHTGYGYIYASESITTVDSVGFLHAERFIEKPPLAMAEEYLSQGHHYWNSGMFMWQTSLIIEELRQYVPDVLNPVADFATAGGRFTGDDPGFESMFARLPAISIDYGVMEKSRRVALIRADFGWNDVGSWDALEEILPVENGNITVGESAMLVDSRRNIVCGDGMLVACLGVEDLVVVATGDAVLVTRKDRAQDVRQIVDKLREKQLDQYL
jgi:mannose-1-phosphate guanylyltransferase